MYTLPRPDDFGNYYIYGNKKKGELLAAIFRSKKLDNGSVIYRESFFAIVEPEPGILANNKGIRYFDDPQQALSEVNYHLAAQKNK